jgi:hypothetical protein
MIVPIEVKGAVALGSLARDTLIGSSIASIPNDWRAERGIYLVLWFGADSLKRMTSPPKGVPRPKTARDLRDAIAELSNTARDGRTEVVVLDLTRPS